MGVPLTNGGDFELLNKFVRPACPVYIAWYSFFFVHFVVVGMNVDVVGWYGMGVDFERTCLLDRQIKLFVYYQNVTYHLLP